MQNSTKGIRIPKALLITGGLFGIMLWLVLLFYAFFLGGSPGPDYERMVPISYARIMALGLAGLVMGLVGIFKSPRSKPLILAAAVFGATASTPLFLLELPSLGIFYLLIGIAPLSGLLLDQNRREEQ